MASRILCSRHDLKIDLHDLILVPIPLENKTNKNHPFCCAVGSPLPAASLCGWHLLAQLFLH